MINYTKDKLEKIARHWEGESLNDQLAGREPTPMITVEMPVEQWERIWSEDATREMYEALEAIINSETITSRDNFNNALEALAMTEGKNDII